MLRSRKSTMITTFKPIALTLLSSAVPGLDAVLGGGLPAFSFNLISGIPGSGKTTLAHQIMFANASPACPALYFTVLGETPLKMLRYQQQMAFFDPDKVGSCIHFIDLSTLLLEQGLGAVLERIAQDVAQIQPGIIVVDSFQTVIRTAMRKRSHHEDLDSFVQRLAVYLTVAQATTFLVGEQLDSDPSSNAVLTIADGIFILSQSTERNSIVRKLQVVKSRGIETMPGLHTFRMTQSGLQVFPRQSLTPPDAARVHIAGRLASGSPGLDELLGGGIPIGDAVLVSGPSGSGKSVLATQFIAAGVRQGEPGVIAIFEEHPKDYLRRAQSLGQNLEQMEREGSVKILYLRPLDLSPDEMLHEIRTAVQQIGAKRVVIDSLSGFELALASTFRTDFRESMYRLVSALTGTGVTVLMTMEITETLNGLHVSPYVISFLADDIILLRYREVAGQLESSLMVVKMRNSAHSKDRRMYEITTQGLIVRATRVNHQRNELDQPGVPIGTAQAFASGLTAQESIVLQALLELQEAPATELGRRTGLRADALLTAALDRLISLKYAIRVEHASAPATYRPVAQPRGTCVEPM
jgi:circadian clock protein KaiC